MKTSKLLCMIIHNEGNIETGTINFYLKELVKKGFIEVSGTSLKLTNKGMRYIGK